MRTTTADAVKIERGRLEIGPVCIHYQVAGAGEPVVLVHGLSGSTRWWRRNIPALAAQCQVYVLDLIGFGGSRGRQRFVLGEAARYLTAWMDRLGIERASLIGHSMGGAIAADLAADFPDRVERLVLVDAAALPFEDGHLPRVLGLARALWWLPLSFLPILITDAARAGPITLWKAARELLTTDMRPKLSRIEAPTLLLWGEHDALVPLAIGRQLNRCLPQAELIVIEGAGHNPMWDRPEQFNRVVVDFLAAEPPARV
jgi:pimeloyl-ACP methyl ester carboxylesterase